MSNFFKFSKKLHRLINLKVQKVKSHDNLISLQGYKYLTDYTSTPKTLVSFHFFFFLKKKANQIT
jgi:hypothetical protein